MFRILGCWARGDEFLICQGETKLECMDHLPEALSPYTKAEISCHMIKPKIQVWTGSRWEDYERLSIDDLLFKRKFSKPDLKCLRGA